MTPRASAASWMFALCTALLLHACGGGVEDTESDDLDGAKTRSCTTTANCTGGLVCVNKKCVACTSDSQCNTGYVCTSGKCTTASGGGGNGGGGGGGSDDGTPTRTSACTPLSQMTGTAINTSHGRLDGYVSYVVPLGGSKSCNGDSTHIHVQVRANGSTYDVAVDVGNAPGDAELYEADLAMPDGSWSEGWHNDSFSYKALGVSASQFTSEVPATLAQKLEAELATVNHISVFGTAYSSHNGAHDIHYYNGNDGALVLQPLSGKAHVLFFRFSTQSF